MPKQHKSVRGAQMRPTKGPKKARSDKPRSAGDGPKKARAEKVAREARRGREMRDEFRPQWGARPYGDDRGRYGREERPARGDRFDRERPERRGRDERDARGFRRDDRDDRYGRDERRFERGPRRDGDERGYGRREAERSERFGADRRGPRPERGFRGGRDERPARFNRDDRPERGDRFDRRPPREERWGRDDRREGGRPGRVGGPRVRPAWATDERPSRERAWGRDERHPDRGERRPERPGRGPRRDFDRGERHPRFNEGPRRWEDEGDDYQESDLMSWEPAEAPEGQSVEVPEGTGFAELGVPNKLVKVLAGNGINAPFPIQAATIPDAMKGSDLLGRGQTGSGKTLAFGLPMITRIVEAPPADQPRGIVLTPTRELAMQVADVISSLATAMGLRTLLVAGGMPYPPQLRALGRGVDIIVATPGRLIDLMEQDAADLSKVMVSVLDEADQMADMGFMPEVTRILDEVPTDAQHMLFSATLDEDVDRVVQRYLTDPVVHGVDPDRASVTTMSHLLLHVAPHDKLDVIAQAANREGRTIVFVRTQLGADRVARQLRERGVMAGALHGGLTQGARARVMKAFRASDVPVLVATDVAARGIHVDDVSLVLQADIPHDSKDYLHRSGRTARAGEEGVVASVVLPHERKRMARITSQAGVNESPRRAIPGDEWLAKATGGSVPTKGNAIEEEAYQALIAPRPTPRKKRPDFGGRPRRFGGHRGGGRGFGRERRSSF